MYQLVSYPSRIVNVVTNSEMLPDSRCYYSHKPLIESHIWPIDKRQFRWPGIGYSLPVRQTFQLLFFVQFCSSSQTFNWHSASRDLSAVTELFLCTTQDVVRISSSVRMENVSNARICVTETTTAQTVAMNRTVSPLLRHHVCNLTTSAKFGRVIFAARRYDSA